MLGPGANSMTIREVSEAEFYHIGLSGEVSPSIGAVSFPPLASILERRFGIHAPQTLFGPGIGAAALKNGDKVFAAIPQFRPTAVTAREIADAPFRFFEVMIGAFEGGAR